METFENAGAVFSREGGTCFIVGGGERLIGSLAQVQYTRMNTIC